MQSKEFLLLTQNMYIKKKKYKKKLFFKIKYVYMFI